MRFANPYALRMQTPRETLVFTASSRIGGTGEQQDYFLNFNDECFVLADGSNLFPHGDTAAKLASETAIWGFKHIRQRPYYWQDKKKFMKRIFRSTNMSVWQKRREHGFEEGLATSLLVCIVGAKMYWLGVKGDMGAWLQRGGSIHKLTREVQPFSPDAKKMLGTVRLGIIPDYVTGPLSVGDVLLLTTSGCSNYVTPQDLQTAMGLAGNTTEDAARAVDFVLQAAETNGSTENMTAAIVKRVATSG